MNGTEMQWNRDERKGSTTAIQLSVVKVGSLTINMRTDTRVFGSQGRGEMLEVLLMPIPAVCLCTPIAHRPCLGEL
jgi:hypothetical protein